MASRKSFTNSFAGGEMSPLMLGHIEDEGYRTGFARGRNMLVLPTGAATKRPPFEFVKAAKAGETAIRLFPFVYGDGDSYMMEWGPAHVRFHTEGQTLKYATPIPVASVDLGTDTFTTAAAHGFTVNEQVRITHKGTSIPGSLATGTIYYVRDIPTPTTFTLSASAGPGALFDLTVNSTIDETSFWRQSELPREYVTPRQVTRNGNNLDAAFAHGLVVTHGDAVHFTTSSADLPAPLVVGTIYYARYIDTDTFSVFPTRADALANTNQILLTDAGTGTHTFHLAYYEGDIVWGGSLTIPGTTSSRAYRVLVDLTTQLPTVADWHQLPVDGTYELAHGLGAAGLATLSYDQSFDEFTFVSNSTRPYQLIRKIRPHPSGISTDTDTIVWEFEPVHFEPSIVAPVFGTPTRNFGQWYSITLAPSSPVFTVGGGTTNHTLLPGDVVYIEGAIGTGNLMTGVAGSPGFFLVTTLTTPADATIQVRRIDNGAEITNGTAAVQAGALRLVGSSSKLSESYKVTALLDTGEESLPSAPLTIVNNLQVAGSSNALTWGAVSGAVRYRLYKEIDEVYGLIVETDQITFTDDGVGPDLAIQPPEYDNDLETEWPTAVGHFQQRQWFGGTTAHPRRMWGSTTGADGSVMLHHERLLLATDRVRFDVAVAERTLIRHVVPMTHLILMTSSAELRATGQNTDVLTPTSIDVRPLSHVGCTGVRPIVVNGSLLWVGEHNQHVYEMQPQPGIVREPVDTSVRSAHLFDNYTIVQSAEQRAPVQVEWWLRSDGKLLGMTYLPEQNIRGWHLHETVGTNAFIMSIGVAPESDGDRLYAAVRRTINSVSTIHIERMGRIADPASLTACKYLDSCVTYSGTAATSIPVPHLPGESVYAVADGKVVGPFTVTTGASPAITLSKAASTVHVGLLYRPELRPMPPALMVDGYGKGRELNVNRVSLRFENSCSVKIAGYQDYDEERGITRRPYEVPGLDNTRMRSKDAEATIDGGWGRGAQVVITQDVPLPLTVVSMTIDVEVGGPS